MGNHSADAASVRAPALENDDVALPPKYAVPKLENKDEEAFANLWRAVQMLAFPMLRAAVTAAVSYTYALGTFPGGSDVIAWTATTETSFTKALALNHAATYFLSVRARNSRQLDSSAAVSDGITIDTTPPAAPAVTDGGDTSGEPVSLTFNVEAADGESPIVKTEYAIGTAPDKTDVLAFTGHDR